MEVKGRENGALRNIVRQLEPTTHEADETTEPRRKRVDQSQPRIRRRPLRGLERSRLRLVDSLRSSVHYRLRLLVHSCHTFSKKM